MHTDGSAIQSKPTIKSSDHITRIYSCATMWHETKDEMIEFLKSIMRMDEDQCARRVAQKYLRIVDPDYYEFESKCTKRHTEIFNQKSLSSFQPILSLMTLLKFPITVMMIFR